MSFHQQSISLANTVVINDLQFKYISINLFPRHLHRERIIYIQNRPLATCARRTQMHNKYSQQLIRQQIIAPNSIHQEQPLRWMEGTNCCTNRKTQLHFLLLTLLLNGLLFYSQASEVSSLAPGQVMSNSFCPSAHSSSFPLVFQCFCISTGRSWHQQCEGHAFDSQGRHIEKCVA